MEDDRAVDEQSKMPEIFERKVYTSETPKLAAALAKARPKFKPLKRTKTVVVKSERGSYEYSYATLADILDSVVEAISSEGLSLSAQSVTGPDGTMVNRVSLLHESGESRSSEMTLPPKMFRMQEIGSALTYSTRYQVSLLLMVAADDDDDGSGADQVQGATIKDKKRQKPSDDPKNAPQDAQNAPGTISKEQRDSFIAAVRSAGLNAEDAREIMRGAAGVEDSKHIPVEKFAQVMQAIIDRVK